MAARVLLARQKFLTGCRITVVCMLWEHAAWVQLPAPRNLGGWEPRSRAKLTTG